MKQFIFLFISVFCISFAANAQLKVEGGNLRFNVSDDFQVPFSNLSIGYTPTSIVWKASQHLFIGDPKSTSTSIFHITPASPSFTYMGPISQGIILMCDNMTNFHQIGVKNMFNASDARTKTNIRSLGSATNTIMRLNPVTYNFLSRSNDTSTRRVSGADGMETGFLAQEVAEVLPNSVMITENDQYLVNYISIIPVLVKAVQEQNAQIEALKAEVQALKNR